MGREKGSTQSQGRVLKKSDVGLESWWGGEDEGGGVVNRAEAVMGGCSGGCVVGWSRSPTNWVRHRLHDLGGQGTKYGSEWVR